VHANFIPLFIREVSLTLQSEFRLITIRHLLPAGLRDAKASIFAHSNTMITHFQGTNHVAQTLKSSEYEARVCSAGLELWSRVDHALVSS